MIERGGNPPIEQIVLEQNAQIELFTHDTPEHLAGMVVGESQELAEAINQAFVNDDLTEVCSEVGDVFYLMIRLCDELGIDWRKAVEMKIIRNQLKYGDQTNVAEAKERWQALGGDQTFSQDYLNGKYGEV